MKLYGGIDLHSNTYKAPAVKHANLSRDRGAIPRPETSRSEGEGRRKKAT